MACIETSAPYRKQKLVRIIQELMRILTEVHGPPLRQAAGAVRIIGNTYLIFTSQ